MSDLIERLERPSSHDWEYPSALFREAAAALRAAQEREKVLVEALKDVTASLVAAISILERSKEAKRAAPSDKMFAQMLRDYKVSVERARAAIPSRPSQREGTEA